MVEEANETQQAPNESSTDNILALLEAARYDELDDVMSLATMGVALDSKDSEGRTALHMAAANGHVAIVDYLIKNGVVLQFSWSPVSINYHADSVVSSVSCIFPQSTMISHNGIQLMVQLNKTDSEPVHRLLHFKQGKSYARNISCPFDEKRMGENGISPSRDINACNQEKNTPLHWACLNGHIEVIKKLILAGADVSILNSHEKTPMDEAVSQGKMGVVDAINTAVAQVELDGVRVS